MVGSWVGFCAWLWGQVVGSWVLADVFYIVRNSVAFVREIWRLRIWEGEGRD